MNSSNITFSNAQNCIQSGLEKDIKYITLVLLYLFGITSNIFIIVFAVQFALRKHLRNMIINMAVSDTLYLACSLWNEIVVTYRTERSYPSGVWGDMLCIIRPFLAETTYKVSLITLLVITIERLKATRQTLQRLQPHTLKRRVAVIAMSWLIPMAISSYFSFPVYFDEIFKGCRTTVTWKSLKIYLSIVFFVMTLVVILILTLLAIIIRRLFSPRAIEVHLNDEQRIARRKRTISAVHMVLASTLIYACCWFPGHLLTTITLLGFDLTISCNDRYYLDNVVYRFLPALNACLSPYIILFLPDFRRSAKRALSFCKTVQHVSSENPISTNREIHLNQVSTNAIQE